MRIPVARATHADSMIIATVALCLSVTSFLYFASQGVTTAFRDSVARLLLGQSIKDGIQEAGPIWPPLPQVAMQPWILNDRLFSSGLAGAIPQMASYVVASVMIYRLARLYVGRGSAIIAFLVFSSPNVLAMQSVPMAESMFISFMVMSAYFLAKWERQPYAYHYLMLTGISVWGAAFTRYEGYILAGCILPVVLVIIGVELRGQRRRVWVEGVVAHVFLFSVIVATALGLWLLYCTVYYGNPLYFATSEYSPWAVAQESLSYVDDDYKTRGKLGFSFRVYARTVLDIVGILPIFLALYGIATLAFLRTRITYKLVPLILFFPFPFFVAALYNGTSVVIWHPAYMNGVNWATRYGTLMVPAAAFFVAYTAGGCTRWQQAIIGVLVIITSVMIFNNGIISLGEAEKNQSDSETVIQHDAARWLKSEHDGKMVLMQRVDNEWMAFEGVPVEKTLSENKPKRWQAALENPADHVDWVVMRQAMRTGKKDKVWRELYGSQQLEDYFMLVYDQDGVLVYRRK